MPIISVTQESTHLHFLCLVLGYLCFLQAYIQTGMLLGVSPKGCSQTQGVHCKEHDLNRITG